MVLSHAVNRENAVHICVSNWLVNFTSSAVPPHLHPMQSYQVQSVSHILLLSSTALHHLANSQISLETTRNPLYDAEDTHVRLNGR